MSAAAELEFAKITSDFTRYILFKFVTAGRGELADLKAALAHSRVEDHPFCDRLLRAVEGRDLWPTPQRDAATLSRAPFLEQFKQVLTPLECAYLIENSRARLMESTVISEGKSVRKANFRNSFTRFLHPGATDELERWIIQKIYKRIGLDPMAALVPNIVYYLTGGIFRPHYDRVHASEANPNPDSRAATNLLYLNDDFEGGETAFVAGNFAHKGDLGDLVRFRNITSDGQLDKSSLHASLPVTTGEKWILVLWQRTVN